MPLLHIHASSMLSSVTKITVAKGRLLVEMREKNVYSYIGKLRRLHLIEEIENQDKQYGI